MHTCVKKARESGHRARSRAVQLIARQCEINDGRRRKGKDGTESAPVDGRRVLQGGVREQTSRTCSH